MMNGSAKLSYWAESVRYTTRMPRPKMMNRLAAGFDFFQRQSRPTERHALQHVLLGQFLHGLETLGRN